MPYWLIPAALAAMNLAAFAAFGLDKSRARRGAWRIRERTLFALALCGGGFGALAGMLCFRHKTRHPRFAIGLPLIAAAQLAALCWLFLAGPGK